jgi:transposase
MEKKNIFAFHSHLSESKFKELVKCFAFDLDARKASDITGLNRNIVNKYYNQFRARIANLHESDRQHS